MSRWIQADDGWYVNLDHVKAIKPTRIRPSEGEPLGSLRLTMLLDDRTQQATVDCDVSVAELLASEVPACAGHEALLAYVDGDEVFVDRYPVIAWRLVTRDDGRPDDVLPVLPVPVFSNQHLIVVLPGGRLVDLAVDGTEYDSIDQMRRELLHQYRKAEAAA